MLNFHVVKQEIDKLMLLDSRKFRTCLRKVQQSDNSFYKHVVSNRVIVFRLANMAIKFRSMRTRGNYTKKELKEFKETFDVAIKKRLRGRWKEARAIKIKIIDYVPPNVIPITKYVYGEEPIVRRDALEICRKIWQAEGFKTPPPKISIISNKNTIDKENPERVLAGSYFLDKHHIELYKNGRNLQVLLHELAHAMVNHASKTLSFIVDDYDHGESFQAIYEHLMNKYYKEEVPICYL